MPSPATTTPTSAPSPRPTSSRPSEAALRETGGGKVTETEVDDEESKYEVEVTLEDGTQVDVQLDEDFEVVGTESDGTGRRLRLRRRLTAGDAVRILAVALRCCLSALTSCGGEESATRVDDQSTVTPSDGPRRDLPQSDEPVDLDPAHFTADVTNPWFPLEPGTRWTYRETTEDGEVVQVVVTATSVTRQIANGVTARVVRDTVTLDGEIIEDTLDWYAQDQAAPSGTSARTPRSSRTARSPPARDRSRPGVDGAQAGVIMPASPEVGMTYRQEYYEGEAEDRGEVLALDQQASVAAGDYDGLVQTADTTPLEPDVLEHKYYAEGVGLVLTIDKEAGGREELLSVKPIAVSEARRAGRVPLGEPY